MKALLICPPTEHPLGGPCPSFVNEGTGTYPPLGLLYVASHADVHTDWCVEVIDARASQMSHDALEHEIRRSAPDVVGVQALTLTLLDALRVARTAKQVDKGVTTVLGGPHPSIYPNETAVMPEVDYVILGEGEVAFTNLLRGIKAGVTLPTILDAPIGDLDALPLPARYLVPSGNYSSPLAKRSSPTTMMTSRGCPYKCLFCDRPYLGKTFRARSPKNVVDEMEECMRTGIREFFLYDDTFAVDRERVLHICGEITARRLDIGWDIRTRVDNIDQELLTHLRRAGCERIHYGVESGSDEILRILRKGITIGQVRRAFKATKQAGIGTLAYFMIGSPGETRAQVLETIELAKELAPDFVQFAILTPYPATPLYRMGLETGQFQHDYWAEFAKHPTPSFRPRYWEENMSQEELVELCGYAYQAFYVRPSYVIRQALSIRSMGELKRKAKAGLRVFKGQ